VSQDPSRAKDGSRHFTPLYIRRVRDLTFAGADRVSSSRRSESSWPRSATVVPGSSSAVRCEILEYVARDAQVGFVVGATTTKLERTVVPVLAVAVTPYRPVGSPDAVW